jgi:hypothetical protein
VLEHDVPRVLVDRNSCGEPNISSREVIPVTCHVCSVMQAKSLTEGGLERLALLVRPNRKMRSEGLCGALPTRGRLTQL